MPSYGFAPLTYAFVKVVRRGGKTCPVRCGRDDRQAYLEHRNNTTRFRYRDLPQGRSPSVEKSEFHGHAFDEADAKNQSHAAFLAMRCRSLQARPILLQPGFFQRVVRSMR